MSYELAFHPAAWGEWKRLDGNIREQFKKKLTERLNNPHLPSARLSGHTGRYKIKLRSVGYRLVYEVRDAEVLVVIIAVGKREHNAAYEAAMKR
jgi:mRNA interferase RelE/StbE